VASIQSMCSNVRLRADTPLPQKPSLQRLLLAVVDHTQNFYNKLELTGQAWSIKPDYALVVSNGVSDYLLAIDDTFGKPIQVLTTYPQNPSFIQRYVDFVELADLNFNWTYPVNAASWMWTDGSNCTAMRMAFYYKDDGSRWVRVLPQPQLTATYAITFQSGNWINGASLEDSPVLSQFHSLIETWATESILASCQWSSDQSYNMGHRKELAISLENDRVKLEDSFDRYCRNLVSDHMGNRISSLDDTDMTLGGWW
jgi:hypothetical protein